MFDNYEMTMRARCVLQDAYTWALETAQPAVEPEHLLIQLLKLEPSSSVAIALSLYDGLSAENFEFWCLCEQVVRPQSIDDEFKGSPEASSSLRRLVQSAASLAPNRLSLGSGVIDVEHLVVAMARDSTGGLAVRFLNEHGAYYDNLHASLQRMARYNNEATELAEAV